MSTSGPGSLSRVDPRLRRRSDGAADGGRDAHEAFRTDLERIRFSPYFSRLAAVTQVITQGAAGQAVHNRLSHSIKVTAVARAIAVRLRNGPHHELLERLGGIDPVVVQAAASAHDLGHPPFGHLGEQVLDRVARTRFGLADGFEGNAQTFRILTELDVHSEGEGLDLTAAVRAGVLKYPWARFGYPEPHPSALTPAPKGGGPAIEGPGSGKFSAYAPDVDEMREVLAAYPAIGPLHQTVECSVMDIADDIAYSLHDLDDFHRAGVLQHASVAAEFRTWTKRRVELERMPRRELRAHDRSPGHAMELLRRRMSGKDDWIFDDEAFAVAVGRVGTDLVDGLLAVPFDSSLAAERAVGAFTSSWIAHLQQSVQVAANPSPRSGHVRLDRQAWHEVSVLKFVHQRYVLDRPDLAMFQRGQAQVLTALAADLNSWLRDPMDAARAPRRLLDLVELATVGYRRVLREQPELLVPPGESAEPTAKDALRWGRGRGILDYVASLTDDRAATSATTLAGHSARLWDAGSAL